MHWAGEKPDLLRERLRRVSQYTQVTQVTSWWVGRIKSSGLPVVQFNDSDVPFALSAHDALNLSRALQAEAEVIRQAERTQDGRLGQISLSRP